MSECKLCKGTRHRWDAERGVHVRCDCLRARQVRERYEEAGGPARFFRVKTFRQVLDEYQVKNPRPMVEACAALKAGEQPAQWILLHGRPEVARQTLLALTLRAACQGGLQVKSVDVPSLIDAEFAPGRGSELLRLDVLTVWIGNDPVNKWHRVVLEKVIRERWGSRRFTMLVSGVEPARLAGSYNSAVIEDALKSRFVRVKVSPGE